MFESILEKILLTHLGKYIEGLDKNSLKMSIWSGDISISNISVKPEVLNMLELPIKMEFNFIGKLVLKIPWKSLGSSPVEVSVEDIFVILESLDKTKWVPIDYRDISKRIELVEIFIKDYLNKIKEAKQSQEAKNDGNEDEGMISRLTAKIIDNIQVIKY